MKLEVLLAKMVSGPHSELNEAKSACLAARSSKIASTTRSAPETLFSRSELVVIAASAGSMRPVSSRPSDDSQQQVGPDVLQRLVQERVVLIVKLNPVTGQGKLLRDAVSHQARTDDGDALDL